MKGEKMTKVILYNDEYYTFYEESELYKGLVEQYKDDFGEEPSREQIEADIQMLCNDEYRRVLDNIQNSMSDRFMMEDCDSHHSEPPFSIGADFENELRDIIENCNNFKIGVDEDGNLYVDVISGNANFYHRYAFKNLSFDAQSILDNVEDSSDGRRENNGWFENLTNCGFDEQDLFKAFWENPKFTQQIRVKDVQYDETSRQKDYFEAEAARAAKFEAEINSQKVRRNR